MEGHHTWVQCECCGHKTMCPTCDWLCEKIRQLQAENKKLKQQIEEYQLLKAEYPKFVDVMLWTIEECPDLSKI